MWMFWPWCFLTWSPRVFWDEPGAARGMDAVAETAPRTRPETASPKEWHINTPSPSVQTVVNMELFATTDPVNQLHSCTLLLECVVTHSVVFKSCSCLRYNHTLEFCFETVMSALCWCYWYIWLLDVEDHVSTGWQWTESFWSFEDLLFAYKSYFGNHANIREMRLSKIWLAS